MAAFRSGLVPSRLMDSTAALLLRVVPCWLMDSVEVFLNDWKNEMRVVVSQRELRLLPLSAL
jgi:hypothetical protein